MWVREPESNLDVRAEFMTNQCSIFVSAFTTDYQHMILGYSENSQNKEINKPPG